MNQRARIAQRLLSNTLAEPAVLIRETMGGRNDYGEYVEGTITQTDIRVITAPLSGEERQILPEALRTEDLRKFWLRYDVEILDADHRGDVLEHLGKGYRAMTVERWGGGIVEVLGKAPVT